MSEPFWKTLSLDEMTREQWESLCDGCARCCLHKLEDEDTGEIHYTNVVCSLLVTEHCSCSRYRDRSRLVPDCLVLDPAGVKSLDWLPDTCAYRLIRDGEDLSDWHPLVSGSAESVHDAGVSVRGWSVSEEQVDPDDLQDHVIG
ncbi:MAG: YcgN family cysteine cluster protein [Pseudomonadota bacterium]|nr:YcgN family cysteine cluster protein [Pseudomonadota bacterium]